MCEILEPHEIPKLVPLAHEFIAESGEDFPFNDEHFVKTWGQIYDAKAGSIIKIEKDGKIIGALGFLIFPDILSGELKASEAFWFVKKEHRGVGIELLDEFERISKRIGVKRMNMVHLKKLMPEKVKSIYLKKGYRELETNYEKVL